MSWLDYTLFLSESLQQMRNLPASNATHLPSSCDEELADEADEPPDSRHYISPRNYRQASLSDGEFSKHVIRQTPPIESLLTRALLTSPTLAPVDRPLHHNPHRGMSNVSIWSNASTAELTSDGFTSPSRANTPSPPPPLFLSGIHSILQSPKTKSMMNGPKKVEIMGDKQDEPLGRKRCITFACSDSQPLSRRPSSDGKQATESSELPKVDISPKKTGGLTFVCAQREKKTESRPIRSPQKEHISFRPTVSGRIHIKPTEQRYDSEGMAESWTNQPIDKSRLLKVDDVLKKERDIRKLSEEVEAEVLQDEEDEDDEEAAVAGIPAAFRDNDSEVEDSDEEEDDEEDEDEDVEGEDDLESDEDEDEDDYDNESGNETDNEEGFASGDDSDDDQLFYGPHPPYVYNDLTRPLWSRSVSETSIGSPTKRGFSAPRRIRSPTPVLPDSTDFVCGTLDEDKEVEQAYLSCMEQRKLSKHKPTPQDIDPSFPTSDPEDSDDEPRQKKTGPSRTGSSSEEGRTGRRRSETAIKIGGSPRGRVHSPAPVRRAVTSRGASPAPRRGRAASPAPIRKNRSAQFNTGGPVVRTRSLPRTAACARRSGKTSRIHSAATSPQKTATRPMVIRRGAMDIVKGLEKKRERRRARLARGKDKAPKGDSWRSGEGVEKMRQLGLEICGKGKVRQAQWVISA
ncbi:hypothetical protein EDC01DRAFT_86470 [Geopyxis carbonaria]|nr:hypothetical protein EDC01DRAFT_86470 [Geopyxis carbonaria]